MIDHSSSESFSVVLRRYDPDSESYKYELSVCVSGVYEACVYALNMNLGHDDIVAIYDTAYVSAVQDMAEYIYFVDSSGTIRMAPQPHEFILSNAKKKDIGGASWLHWGNEFNNTADMIFLSAVFGVKKSKLSAVSDSWINFASDTIGVERSKIDEIRQAVAESSMRDLLSRKPQKILDDINCRADAQTRDHYLCAIKEILRINYEERSSDVASCYARCAGRISSAVRLFTGKSREEINAIITEMLLKEIPLHVILEVAEIRYRQ